ncbi:MAG: molybdopterin-guanine dinucleotide biosynthesis protein MobB [Desulfovibrio sp.]
MIAANITGFKNSGKTTLTALLAAELRSRGHRVAALKNSHHDYNTTAGTDTEQLLENADISGGSFADRTLLQFDKKLFITDLIPLIDADILLLEGGKSTGCMPRIVITDSNLTQEETEQLHLDRAIYTLAKTDGTPSPAVIAEIASCIEKDAFLLPNLNCGGCGRENCAGLTADIVADNAKLKDCIALHGDISIDIDGTPVSVNPFVADIFKAGITGMLAQLKGYRKGDITITIKNG